METLETRSLLAGLPLDSASTTSPFTLGTSTDDTADVAVSSFSSSSADSPSSSTSTQSGADGWTPLGFSYSVYGLANDDMGEGEGEAGSGSGSGCGCNSTAAEAAPE